ncbi:MAG: prolyl oligopeptidase family serine peptidase [Planctomycetota bacterium]|nr:prolyl oligopeptidase family serine peptidase [Planctomycetota bacterium]
MSTKTLLTHLAALLLLFCSTAITHAQSSPELHWSPDGSQFWYQQKLRENESEFLLFDVLSRTTTAISAQIEVKELLAESLNCEVSEVAIQSLYFSGAKNALTIEANSKYFLYDPESKPAIVPAAKPFNEETATPFFMPARSGDGRGETNITLVNLTDAALHLVWINERTRRQRYETIDSGESCQQHTFIGHVWGLESENGKLLACFEATDKAHMEITEELLRNVGREEKSQQEREKSNWLQHIRGQTSPDRSWRAEIRADEHLWLDARIDESDDVKLSDKVDKHWSFRKLGEGTRWYSESAAKNSQGEMHWSPDSKYLVAFQTKKVGDAPTVYYVESTPRNQLQPILHSYQYPKPGDDLPIKRLKLYSIEEQAEIEVDHQLFSNPFSIRFLGWAPEGDRCYLQYNQRGHQALRIIEVTASTGKVRPIIDETSDTFIHYSDRGKSVFEQLTQDHWLWASERSGWNHLYRYDRSSGSVVNAVTEGEWNVKRIERIDREKEQIWFYAVGLYADRDPYHEHFCRVNFDGSNFTKLTDGDGTHRVKFIRDGQFLLDSYSRVDMATVTELRDAKTGEKVVKLSSEDTEKRFGKRRLTTRFRAPGRDGETDIWGIIHWPSDFDPRKKYPVIENIYAGPHDHHVPKSFGSRYRIQHTVADAGFIVVQIDGMGTAWRSKAFHDLCYKNLRDAGFPDRIAWLKAAAEEYPQMDIKRVGIFGGSAGGQNTMAALLWHGDFYKVGVADCGCHDNRMDKIWWNEQWMGWPVDESYIQNSNMENAHLLQGKLMLTLGEKDENVDPASTIQVVKKLIEADKDFEFVLIPGGGHGAGESRWASQKRLRFFEAHLGSPQTMN